MDFINIPILFNGDMTKVSGFVRLFPSAHQVVLDNFKQSSLYPVCISKDTGKELIEFDLVINPSIPVWAEKPKNKETKMTNTQAWVVIVELAIIAVLMLATRLK